MSDLQDRLEAARLSRQLKNGTTAKSIRESERRGAEVLGSAFEKGLTANMLAKLFKMDDVTVRRRLIQCPVATMDVAVNGHMVPHYHVWQAAPFLVESKIDPEVLGRLAKSKDLPNRLQQQFWDAMLKRQRWEEQAGDLWRTEKVQEVLGSAFQSMKFTMQLWMDTIQNQTEVSPRQREIILNLVDSLQQQVYDDLIRNLSVKKTGPLLDEHPDHEAGVPDDYDPEVAALV